MSWHKFTLEEEAKAATKLVCGWPEEISVLWEGPGWYWIELEKRSARNGGYYHELCGTARSAEFVATILNGEIREKEERLAEAKSKC
jgi:hypothetical protein